MPNFQVLVVGDNPTELLFSRGKLVAFDTETTGLDYVSDMLGFSLAWYADEQRSAIKTCYCHMPLGQMSLDELTIVIGEMSGAWLISELFQQHIVVFHNQPFDYRVALRACHIDPPVKAHDTMHLARLSGFNSSYKLIHLYGKHVTPGKVPDWYRDSKEERANIGKWPLEKRARYARLDASMTLELLAALHTQFSAGMLQVKRLDYGMYGTDRAFARLVMQLIQRGLPLDQAWCEQRLAGFKARTLVIERDLLAKGLRFIGSNESVATFLYRTLNVNEYGAHAVPTTNARTKKWPGGLPSVDEKTLLQFKDYPQVKLILEHRGLVHAMSTWLHPYMSEASIDGHVHSLINPFGTVSARIAASRPNVTAIPMEDRGDAFGSFKGMFKADKGRTLLAFDLKQAEVRLAAMCARANSLARMFNADRDPYVEMADRTWHDPTRRQDAKRAVLSGIYEIGPTAYATKYDVSEQEGYLILRDFRRSVPEIKAASKLDSAFAEANGYIPAYNGKPRWFGPAEIDPVYKAFNQRVQMGVAQLMQDAMLQIEAAHPGLMLLQVHDSVILDVPDSERATVERDVREIMAGAAPQNLRRMTRPAIPFLVDVKPWQLIAA